MRTPALGTTYAARGKFSAVGSFLRRPARYLPMLLLRSSLRRSVLWLLCLGSAACGAQGTQFQLAPQVEPTGGRVTAFITGAFQTLSVAPDILYTNSLNSGGSAAIQVGELLNLNGAGFTALAANTITFTGASQVAIATGRFLGGLTYAFAISGTTPNLCLYAGTLAAAPPSGTGHSYSGGNAFPPTSGSSGCMTIAAPPSGVAPRFDSVYELPSRAGSSQMLLVDGANSLIDIVSFTGATASGGVLLGAVVTASIAVPAPDGTGPVYVGDFNRDGNMDFIVNGQTGATATEYFTDGTGHVGNGIGPIPAPVRYVFSGIQSMLLADMDRDGDMDMVVENSVGGIEIHTGMGGGIFSNASAGGTAASPGSATGNGGRLAAINPNTLDILTTTPIGLSVLSASGGGLNYSLKTIYNIGPGRTSFALADFYASGNLDLAVDSPEGIAIVRGGPGGSFLSSQAYSTLAPALGATVGQFRNGASNPQNAKDVVAATGATQAQLMVNDGSGVFSAYPAPVDTGTGPTNVPAGVWSNIASGDFDGDGKLDVLYTLTGIPLSIPTPLATILYFQYGIGDGTFSATGNAISSGASDPPQTFYGETAIGYFNGDSTSDVAFDQMANVFVALGSPTRSGLTGGFSLRATGSTGFNQVATGYFKGGRSSQQDVVFQQGATFVPYGNKQDGTGKNFTAMPGIAGPAAPLYATTLLLTDIDGDGKGDLVAVYYNAAAIGGGGSVYIWYGNGDGTFAASPQVLSMSRDYYLGAVADMNADGRPDLVLSDGSLISILYNQGGGSFGTLLSNGQYSTEQHFLAGQGINSISLADVNGDGVPDVIAATGGLTISNPIVLGGETASSLTLPANPADINTGGITLLLNHFTTKPVTGTLTVMPEPSVFGAAFTMTAIVTPSAGVAVPTGPVQFYVDGFPTGSAVTLTAGAMSSMASSTVAAGNAYPAGNHAITALYLGDSVNSPLNLGPVTHVIGAAQATTSTTLLLCVGPTALCPSSGFISPPFMPLLAMIYGQTYNGTSVVTASDGAVLAGNTLFYDNFNGTQTLLCTLTTSVGGSCPPSVGTGTPVGTHVFTAVYAPPPGDTSHTGSTSPPVTIIVTQDTALATASGSPNPSPAGQPVTLTATITGVNAPAPLNVGTYVPATGSIVFSYNGSVLGSAPLVAAAGGTSATASLTTSVLPLGSDVVTATYVGSGNFTAASATFTEVITPSLAGGFTITATPSPVSVGVGYSALLTITVTPTNGFSQAVNLSCANLPPEATCFFDSATIAAGGGTTNLVVSTSAPHSCGTNQPYFLGSNGGGGLLPFGLPALAGLLAVFLPGRRRLRGRWLRGRWLRGLLAVAVAALTMQATGCGGNCTDLGTRPATYTFQINGTAATTGAVVSQPVTITVAI
jgi:hypothetical protein